jgi:hypothetical protein
MTEIVVDFGCDDIIREILSTSILCTISMWYAHKLKFLRVPNYIKYYKRVAVTVCDAPYAQWTIFRLLGAEIGDTLLLVQPANLLIVCNA